MSEKQLIEACRDGNRKAQSELYRLFSPLAFSVCRRYISNEADAEDVFVEGMCKVFFNIASFRMDGSFEGWIRRIMVNESLMFLRKKHALSRWDEIADYDAPEETTVLTRLHADEILRLLAQLPPGYRTVFNMYAVEGYKHREIAEELGISINTSKSQYLLAQRRLQDLVTKQEVIHARNE